MEMAEAWSGDGRYFLPARKVEPYRLWFEYLKLAMKDSDISIDRDFYRDWGDVENTDFDKWWGGSTWRNLFAIDTSVRLLETDENLPKGDPSLVVRLPLGKDIKDTLRDVQQLLEEHDAGVKFEDVPKGRFSLSEGFEKGFLKKMNRARLMLRLYGGWLDHREKDVKERTQLAATDVYDWATAWNNKIRERKWKRELTFIPECFTYYVENGLRGTPIRMPENASDKVQRMYVAAADPENARRQVQRYIQKARKIAENVGRGDFPGKY